MTRYFKLGEQNKISEKGDSSPPPPVTVRTIKIEKSHRLTAFSLSIGDGDVQWDSNSASSPTLLADSPRPCTAGNCTGSKSIVADQSTPPSHSPLPPKPPRSASPTPESQSPKRQSSTRHSAHQYITDSPCQTPASPQI